LGKSASAGLYRWAVSVALSLCYALVAWQTAERVRDAEIASLAETGRSHLNLYVADLQGQLERYEYLPELISTDARLLELLRGPSDPARVDALNRFLEEVNLITGAADTYLMDRDGLTVAASNWAAEQPFVGSNFSYRPYFQAAIQGRLGRYFALGTTSGKRGYYFAYPVRDSDDILGAVVVKVDMSNVEMHWGGLREEVIVVDEDGVVFAATRPAWRYRTLSPLAKDVRDQIGASRRYPESGLTALSVLSSEPLGDQSRILELWSDQATGRAAGRTRYLAQEQDMPEAGWKVYLLTSLAPLQQQVLQALTIVTAIFTALLFLGMGLRQRYKRRKEQARFSEQEKRALRFAHDQLELRVKERTADLSASNRRLNEEIEERRHAEEELRQTQGELIQAAKLATLGQMAAGINHELNQPLAAIRSYADNGRALLERERLEEVRGNLEQISDLTGRMARIGSQLRIFSRKSSGQIGDVSVQSVIEASRSIVAPRVKRTGTEIRVEIPVEPLFVRADEVLLQQVLVNLVGNAIQAVDGEKVRLVRICASTAGARVLLVVEDSGPGIANGNLERIFDPFFTTKEASEGLGLGLTISNRIIQDLKGSLTVSNGELGGARFEIFLPAAPAGDLSKESHNICQPMSSERA